jgi:hypothetical protein
LNITQKLRFFLHWISLSPHYQHYYYRLFFCCSNSYLNIIERTLSLTADIAECAQLGCVCCGGRGEEMKKKRREEGKEGRKEKKLE